MTQFIALTDGVEVNGETVISIIDGMGNIKETAYKILAENGIVQPEPGSWYSQQAWLDSFKKIASSFRPITLTYIGRKIPENAIFPPGIDDIEKALMSIDVAYHINHRIKKRVLYDPATEKMKEGIGHYFFKKAGASMAIMVCNNPYPCDFDKGIIDAMAFRYRPQGTDNVRVTHEGSGHCRKNGDEFCTYIVEW